ncbi:MAG: hypothetical protein JXB62_13975 [Pirellulales bacterium]|nr:hypothetical protein [Pirellulales bacterium]
MASLPSYLAAAKPMPQENRAAWYKNTAQTYAGIMLWFVFWQDVVSGSPTPGGSLAAGLGVALLGLLIAALFCHFLTYLVPGLLGMKTGLPLYVVGTSTYGVRGGFIMPGFLMGALQFGWLAVNAFFSCWAICTCFEIGLDSAGDVIVPGPVHGTMTIAFILLAVFVGLKGIQYVARVATFMPLIPLAILVILLVKTAGGLGSFDAQKLVDTNQAALQADADTKAVAARQAQAKLAEATTDAEKATAQKEADTAEEAATAALAQAEGKPIEAWAILLFLSTYVVGFFATAGAAGADFGMNNRNASDVQWGGLVGIVGATFFAGGVAILVVAGAYGAGLVTPELQMQLNPVKLMGAIVPGMDNTFLLLLAVAAFAPACFPAFIAANSFKTTMPKFGTVAVAIGTAASILLAVTGLAGQAVAVFKVVGASFGPICGAMAADYLLSGRKWAGPRAGFNLAGWISWAVGFVVGAIDLVADNVSALSGLAIGVPCPPMAALIVGFVLYLVLAKAGLESEKVEMPEAA